MLSSLLQNHDSNNIHMYIPKGTEERFTLVTACVVLETVGDTWVVVQLVATPVTSVRETVC